MKPILFAVSAAALAGAVLPVSASAPAASAAGQSFGYSSVVSASPVKMEFYEPTIPIPANPQFELEMGYTKVEADSGSSLGRASWLWPGDPVGEGAKTFGEQLNLPPQLFENGYPVQVNSGQPSGEPQQADEPFPGTVMRTSASDTKTIAQAGFSPDGQVQDGGKDGGDEGGDAGTPGVPGLPTLPGVPSATGMLQQFGQAITGGQSAAADSPQGESPPNGLPGLPPQVAGLVDVEGYTSSSQNVVGDGQVTTISRTALGDVTLLGGMVTLDGIVATSTTGSDGSTNTVGGRSVLGGMTVNGQEFSFGPGGYSAGPQQGDAPAIPDQAAAALKQIGVTLTLPKPQLHKKGDTASSTIAALQVEIDASKVMKALHQLPIDDVINQLPNDPQELKSTLQAISGLSPRIVITLGTATTQVETVDGIDVPTDIPDNDPGSTGGSSDGGASAGPSAAGGSAPSATAPGPAAGGDAPSAAGDLPPSRLAGSGLPPLYSIPGAILMGGIALAAVGGTWLRRAGVIALGGTGSCPHGLDSGLPDLRKA